MSPADKRVAELLDRWLASVELHARYLELDEPYDCAGSAKAEALGIVLTEKIESADPTALIGLPLIALTGMLTAAGFAIF